MNSLKNIKGITLAFVALFIVLSCNNQPKTPAKNVISTPKDTSYIVTFIELGSIRCIPCKQMQPVMKSIKQNYGNQVKVVFHDVWTEAGAHTQKNMESKQFPHRCFLMKPAKSISDTQVFSRKKNL